MKTAERVQANLILETVWAADGIRQALDRHVEYIDSDDDGYISVLASSLKVILMSQLELAEKLVETAEGKE